MVKIWNNPVIGALFSRGYIVIGNDTIILDVEKTKEAFIKGELTRDTKGKCQYFRNLADSIALINNLA